MLVVLVGPKGSGKSHVGRVLERRLDVAFFHVEPLWMRYHAECRAAGREPVIAEGVARVRPEIQTALATHRHVIVETTGASAEILDDLLALAPAATVVVRVAAPLDVCLARIAARDPTHQIPLDEGMIRRVHALGTAAPVDAACVLANGEDLSEDGIVARLAPLVATAESAEGASLRLVAITAAGEPVEPLPDRPAALADVLPATAALARRVGWEPPWICYLAVEGRRVVGTCGFKAPPHAAAVEIAYFTFPSHEGRGIATRMAAHLLAVAALAIPRPGAVTAETLPAESASTAILRRLGFTRIGERLDPEDGRVWQWRAELGTG